MSNINTLALIIEVLGCTALVFFSDIYSGMLRRLQRSTTPSVARATCSSFVYVPFRTFKSMDIKPGAFRNLDDGYFFMPPNYTDTEGLKRNNSRLPIMYCHMWGDGMIPQGTTEFYKERTCPDITPLEADRMFYFWFSCLFLILWVGYMGRNFIALSNEDPTLGYQNVHGHTIGSEISYILERGIGYTPDFQERLHNYDAMEKSHRVIYHYDVLNVMGSPGYWKDAGFHQYHSPYYKYGFLPTFEPVFASHHGHGESHGDGEHH